MASSLLLWPRGNQGRSHLATWRGRAAWPQRLRGVDGRVLAGDGQREEAAKARGVVTHHGDRTWLGEGDRTWLGAGAMS